MKQILITLGLLAIILFAVNAQEGPSDEQLKEANNPLASKTAVNLQNYYAPVLNDSDLKANSFILRVAQPFGGGRWLFRFSLPVQSTIGDGTTGGSESGLGNSNAFLTYSFISRPKMLMGIGPYVLIPGTVGATKDNWELGAAFVAFFAPTPVLQGGGLITYNTDVAGSVDTSLLTMQPFFFVQAGNGLYFRTAPIWTFDFANGRYNFPIGFGIGKVVATPGGSVFNMFIEPQYSIYSKGAGLPVFQIYAAMNMQFGG